jgi:hypothetical protein
MIFNDYPNVNHADVYNKELKESFLNSLSEKNDEDLIIQYIRLFNRTGPVEEIFKKDLCMFDDTEFEYLFEDLGLTTYHNFYLNRSLVRNYITFCIQKGMLDEYSNMTKIKFEDFQGTVPQEIRMFKDYDEVKRYLNTIDTYNSHDKMLVKKGVFLLTYLGFTKEEIPYVKKEDVDEIHNFVRFNRKVVPLDKYMQGVLFELKHTKHVSASDGKSLRLNDTPYLIRIAGQKHYQNTIKEHFITRTFSEYKQLSSTLPVDNEFFGKQPTYLNVLRCGHCHRLFDYQQKNNDILLHIDYIDRINEIIRSEMDSNTEFYAFIGNYVQWKNYYFQH